MMTKVWILAVIIVLIAHITISGHQTAVRPFTLRRLVDGPGANLPCWHASPDGQFLAFIDGDNLTLGTRDIETGATRIVTRGSESERLGAACLWSPDGQRLAYIRHAGTEELHVVPPAGGPSQLVRSQKGSDQFTPLAWTSNSDALIGEAIIGGERSLARLGLGTGDLRVLRTNGSRPVGPAHVSPDGRYIAFGITSSDGLDRDLLTMGSDGTSEVAIASDEADDFPLGWAPDGRHLLFGSTRAGIRSIWAVPLAGGKAAGDPVLVKAGMGRISSSGVARNGTLFAAVHQSTSDVYVASLDERGYGAGRPVRLTQPVGFAADQERGQATWSPDGQRIAFTVVDDRTEAIAVQSPGSGSVQVHPLRLRQLERPVWFPDGTAIAVKAGSGADLGVYRVDLRDGSTTHIAERGNYFGLSPDGAQLFYTRLDNNVQTVQRRDLTTGVEQAVDKGRGQAMKVSPDGKFVAVYGLDQPGLRANAPTQTASIMVVPSTGGERRPLVTGLRDTINTITWSHDSQRVLFVRCVGGGPSQAYEVWSVPLTGGQPDMIGIRSGWTKHLSVSPDGRQLALSVVSGEMEVWSMQNVFPAHAR